MAPSEEPAISRLQLMRNQPEPTLKALRAHERRNFVDPRYKIVFGVPAFIVGSVAWLVLFSFPSMIILGTDPDTPYDGISSMIGLFFSSVVNLGIPVGLFILLAALFLRRVDKQWVHVVVIALTASTVTFGIVAAYYQPLQRHLGTVIALTILSFVVAAIGRMLAIPLTRRTVMVADPPYPPVELIRSDRLPLRRKRPLVPRVGASFLRFGRKGSLSAPS